MVQKDGFKLSCLIIEDNPGDFLLISDYLDEKFLNPEILRAASLKEAKEILSANRTVDIILLDLGLPDVSGIPLIREITDFAKNIPVIIVTGHENFDFSTGAFGLGASDYLTKDELTAGILHKSITFSLERDKFFQKIKESERKYSCLFQLNPLPRIVFRKDLSIYDCNQAAIHELGCAVDSVKFLSTLFVEEEREDLKAFLSSADNQNSTKVFHYLDRNSSIKTAEVKFSLTDLDDEYYGILSIVDITEKVQKTERILAQYERLKEISWMQSHLVRAPLARLMGLANMIKDNMVDQEEIGDFLEMILYSCNELDQVIHEITDKSKEE